jgi:hypothetical protein
MAEPATQPLPTAPRVTHPETKPATTLVEVGSATTLTDFQRVPEFVHWGDPYYISPMKADERATLDSARGEFFRHGEAKLWTAWHGHGAPVGRILAAIDRDHDPAQGFFGWLDFMNDARISEALIVQATTWLRERAAKEIVGPVAFSPRYGSAGLLVDGFYDDAVIGTNYNPPSYPGFIARLELEKHRDDFAFELDLGGPPPERLAARAKEVAARDGLTARTGDAYEIQDLAARLRAPIPAGLIELLPEFPEGAVVLQEGARPVGFALAVVDWNRVLKHLGGRRFPLGWIKTMLLRRTIDRVRVCAAAVEGEGRARIVPLANELWRRLAARGFSKAVIATIPETNARAVKLAEGLGAKKVRTWRTFRVPAGWPAPGKTTPSRPVA